MATAKRLKSGSWRCQVYSHSVIQTDKNGNIVYDKNGNPKKKRIYKSFTSNDKTKRGKVEAEAMANEFILHQKDSAKGRDDFKNITLYEAIEKYIDQKSVALSPSTLKDYDTIKRCGFQDIMNVKIKEFNEDMLQDAVNREAMRPSRVRSKNPKPISSKRLYNEFGLLRPVLKKYRNDINYDAISLPEIAPNYKELITPDVIFDVVRGTDIELPVLLAMWLSFTMSEIRGLTKSKSIDGDYITIKEVIVSKKGGEVRKEIAKNKYRNRRLVIPKYIKSLIDEVEGDIIVPMSAACLYHKWTRLLEKNNLPKITFHDLRHVNASVMALLKIPDKYAQERGGWKTDYIMKRVYQQTFSDERRNVDRIIDRYFEEKCNTNATQNI